MPRAYLLLPLCFVAAALGCEMRPPLSTNLALARAARAVPVLIPDAPSAPAIDLADQPRARIIEGIPSELRRVDDAAPSAEALRVRPEPSPALRGFDLNQALRPSAPRVVHDPVRMTP